MTDSWLARAASDFWARTEGEEPYPRSLETAVLQALPVVIVKLPRLTLFAADQWLRARGHLSPFRASNRRLRGCLIAHRGQGIMLIDGTDVEDERRYTVAHEVAHFLLDYLEPRQKAIAAFGSTIVEVLDGLRPPSIEERADAVLVRTSIGVHTHLMQRSPSGLAVEGRVWQAEERADQLACELLAPADEVCGRVSQRDITGTYVSFAQLAKQSLLEEFRLPPDIASIYATDLTTRFHPGPTIREWLGLGS